MNRNMEIWMTAAYSFVAGMLLNSYNWKACIAFSLMAMLFGLGKIRIQGQMSKFKYTLTNIRSSYEKLRN